MSSASSGDRSCHVLIKKERFMSSRIENVPRAGGTRSKQKQTITLFQRARKAADAGVCNGRNRKTRTVRNQRIWSLVAIFTVPLSIQFSRLPVQPPPKEVQRRVEEAISPGRYFFISLCFPTRSRRSKWEPVLKSRVSGCFSSKFVTKVYSSLSMCGYTRLLSHCSIAIFIAVNVL